ncbi:S8 family serine peptidase [Abyssisolibacter fermentans]|uniref:S8 family serine peptidase n=1 Tax=Abyssisolibacter fermentans TaxID=1766203 RepID=UPI00082D0FBB|nr:S8 family serine peptidase [Abyssisolibacter fermentans]
MLKVDSFNIDDMKNELQEDDLRFLNLSGRKAFHSQGILGQGVIVAVVDTGVSNHTELEGRILRGRNFCNYRGSTNTEDDNGHGTHVAGSIAGTNVGIAPKTQILPVKVLSGDGDGNIKDIIKALQWIKEYKSKDGRKVSIVSISLSTNGQKESEKDLGEFHESIKELVKSNLAVICSAGNSSIEEIRYPAVFKEVICVGAVDLEKKKALFSTEGEHVDVCQIGVNVLSCWYKQSEYDYAVMSGTSMSTPIVSGIAALIACKHKVALGEAIPEDYLWRNLKMSTKDLGIPGADTKYGVGFCTLQPLQTNIIVQHKNKTMIVNDQKIKLDKAPEIQEGRFMLPARFISEATGAFIEFDKKEKSAKFIY